MVQEEIDQETGDNKNVVPQEERKVMILKEQEEEIEQKQQSSAVTYADCCNYVAEKAQRHYFRDGDQTLYDEGLLFSIASDSKLSNANARSESSLMSMLPLLFAPSAQAFFTPRNSDFAASDSTSIMATVADSSRARILAPQCLQSVAENVESFKTVKF